MKNKREKREGNKEKRREGGRREKERERGHGPGGWGPHIPIQDMFPRT